MKTTAERFWSKVDGGDVDTCWTWTGARLTNGYGSFITAWPSKTVAHRWAYEQLVADVPAGLDLDHLCRNRACVNPWHLEPVTRKVNLARGIHANAVKSECRHGHPYTAENTRMNHRGARECITCRTAWMRTAAQRRAAKKLAALSRAA